MRRAQAPLKFVVIAVGTRMPSWVTDGCREYAKRMPPGTALELVEIKAEARASGKTAAQLLAAEAVRIRAALPKGGRVVALDERGKDSPPAASRCRSRRGNRRAARSHS